MLKHNGGDRVGKGTYWNLTNGERIDISVEGTLPGDAKKAYYRMPAAAIIVAGPSAWTSVCSVSALHRDSDAG